MVPHLLDAGVDKRVIDVMDPNEGWYCYGGFSVSPVPIPHNVPNCGWRYLTQRFDAPWESVFYATDCSTLEHVSAKGYTLYLIEANHTRAELEARIREKEAAGEYAYEREASRNHLSQEQALDWLAENMGPTSQYVFLHQHKPREKEQTTWQESGTTG